MKKQKCIILLLLILFIVSCETGTTPTITPPPSVIFIDDPGSTINTAYPLVVGAEKIYSKLTENDTDIFEISTVVSTGYRLRVRSVDINLDWASSNGFNMTLMTWDGTNLETVKNYESKTSISVPFTATYNTYYVAVVYSGIVADIEISVFEDADG